MGSLEKQRMRNLLDTMHATRVAQHADKNEYQREFNRLSSRSV